MFKIICTRDILADTPEERNKINGICIMHGYHCYQTYCDHHYKCKYSKTSLMSKFLRKIRMFFQNKLHIKIPIYITKCSTDLSGTTTCPFKVSRQYSCYNCTFQAGLDENYEGLCGNTEYIKQNREGRSHEHYVHGKPYCKFFQKDKYADHYDKKTGQPLYDDEVK